MFGSVCEQIGAGGAPDGQGSVASRQGLKVISMTVKAEPNVLVTDLETVGGTIYANGAVHPHLNSYLVMDDPTGVTAPILATELVARQRDDQAAGRRADGDDLEAEGGRQVARRRPSRPRTSSSAGRSPFTLVACPQRRGAHHHDHGHRTQRRSS